VIFNSNWGNSNGADIDAYIIQLQPGSFGGTSALSDPMSQAAAGDAAR
jgi:hypothetical protein